MLNLQHALFCNDVSAHTHIYTHIILYKASIWILNVLFLITPLRIILLFTAPPKIIVHCAHYIESPYELCCILAHELLCVSRTFLKAPPQRMMLYFLLCLYTPLYSMHFVQTRHKNDCASHKNRPALLLCTLVPILFFAIYKQIKKVFFRQRPYRVECTGSLPNSEVKRRRARLVLGWGTAREDLRVLLAFFILVVRMFNVLACSICRSRADMPKHWADAGGDCNWNSSGMKSCSLIPFIKYWRVSVAVPRCVRPWRCWLRPDDFGLPRQHTNT